MLLHDSKYLTQKGAPALRDINAELSVIDVLEDAEKQEFISLLRGLYAETVNE